jgi:hypothetical protein
MTDNTTMAGGDLAHEPVTNRKQFQRHCRYTHLLDGAQFAFCYVDLKIKTLMAYACKYVIYLKIVVRIASYLLLHLSESLNP